MNTTLVYHRPTTLDEAVRLLAPGVVVLAGGTVVNAGTRPTGDVLVDLQALDLSGIDAPTAATLVVGATTRLSAVATDARVPSWLRDLARRELPSSLRTLATVGGTVIAGGPHSVLLAGLLACDAVVTLVGANGSGEVALADLLEELATQGQTTQPRIITSIRLDIGGDANAQSTARTTADVPIVACVVRRTPKGLRTTMSGVAGTVVIVDDVEALNPPADFRGSTEYRRHLARVLQARAITELGVGQ
ncbi:MAG: FAD binding domain-containing protein [Actinobacteria bacterium]|nr:FAD binding domain-containing protein [Actinomycetota bacterium]